jgi:hypothetical protein
LIVDRQGRIAYAIRGATVYTDLLPMVEKVAAEGHPTTPSATLKPTKGSA